MNIAEVHERIKAWRKSRAARREALQSWFQTRIQGLPKDVLVVGIIALSSMGSFGLGMLVERDLGQGSAFTVKEVPLEEMPAAALAAEPGITIAPASLPTAGGEVIASKNGTKYYYPWCSGISRITAANRITFASSALAEARGYTLSSTCKNP
ncbi:MAG TPA: hypothetical protein VM103_01810 [Candidatus Paceibacterota bacterium]|nr:hypothetical protein [Candidatus Paceibacterota bacterium]